MNVFLCFSGGIASGKTTLSRMILNLVPPTAGTITFRGSDVNRAEGRSARMRFMAAVQPIFQNPFEAFNPLKRVDTYLLTTARRFCGARQREEAERPRQSVPAELPVDRRGELDERAGERHFRARPGR